MKKILTIMLSLGLALALTGCKKKKLKVDLKDKGLCIGRSYERYSWDIELKKWEPYEKDERIYDEKGNLLYDLTYIWKKKDKWTQLTHKKEYVYDDNGLLIKTLSSFDYSYNTLRENNQIEEFTYEGSTLKSKITRTKTLGVVDIETYAYDSKGNISTVIVEKNAGVPSYKKEYVYNESNLKTKVLYYEYDTKTQNYKDPIDCEKYEYDEKNNLITYYHVNTDQSINEIYWGSDYKEVSTYDEKNRRIETTGYILENGNASIAAKYTYDYFDDGNRKSFTVSTYLENEWILRYKVIHTATIYDN